MPRIPRLVVPGYPHHVTQRGNRRQKTFFHARDYLAYLEFIAAAKLKARCDIWAYCLMPNHVHFVMVPQHKDSLSLLFKEAHRRYTRRINFRENWRGHLWQERFHSFVMDELDRIATEGVAYDREEHEVGISAIAALVVDDANNYAAISVAMPTASFERREEFLTEIVRRTAHDASLALGWRGSNKTPKPNTIID